MTRYFFSSFSRVLHASRLWHVGSVRDPPDTKLAFGLLQSRKSNE